MAKDINAVLEEGAPRKRIRTHLRESALQNLMAKKPSKLAQLLAVAAYKAEEIRADSEQRPIDDEAALARFEQNPFRWQSQDKHGHIEVGFLWMWQDRANTGRKSIFFPRLDNVFKRLIPRPPGLDEADEEIYKRLREVASLETKLRKALSIRFCPGRPRDHLSGSRAMTAQKPRSFPIVREPQEAEQ